MNINQILIKNNIMNTLLEAINRGILRGLNEHNIEILSDLPDESED
mgnify:CR=1 FL=1